MSNSTLLRRARARWAGTTALLAAALLVTGCAVGVPGEPTQSTAQPTTTSAATPTPTVAPPVDESPQGALLLIMDASGSMTTIGPDGAPLLEAAKDALHGVVTGLPEDLPTGLRVFGHRYPNTDRENGCRDSELIAPVAPLDRAALGDAIDAYTATGFTPIGYSLQKAAEDLPPEGPRAIILVSDGEDTCGSPDPCQAAAELRGDGVDLVIHTVGLALGDNPTARDQLSCVAQAGGGRFTDVANVGDLTATLESMSKQETNRFKPTGDQLDGAEIPRDARTGRLDVPYVDTVTHGSDNYYRFEIPRGATVEADVVTQGIPSAGKSWLCMTAYLADDGGEHYENSEFGGDQANKTQIDNVDPVVIDDADEVYLKLEADNCRGGGGDLQFHVEFTITVVD